MMNDWFSKIIRDTSAKVGERMNYAAVCMTKDNGILHAVLYANEPSPIEIKHLKQELEINEEHGMTEMKLGIDYDMHVIKIPEAIYAN